jgi:hypothetical protein
MTHKMRQLRGLVPNDATLQKAAQDQADPRANHSTQSLCTAMPLERAPRATGEPNTIY